jgi:hypothetical protein
MLLALGRRRPWSVFKRTTLPFARVVGDNSTFSIVAMASKNLVVNFTFNPPQVKVIGPVRETTIEKLNSVLPRTTTSLRSSRAGNPKFEYQQNPPHWKVTLDGQFCDQVGESALFLALLDALEEEGGWKLVTTQAITQPDQDSHQQDFYETHKFFFSRVM